MRSKNIVWITLTTLLLTTVLTPNITKCSGSPTLYVDPETTTQPTGDFTIQIKVTNITSEKSLYGWEFNLTFIPSVLSVTNVTGGPFLRDAASQYNYTTIFLKSIDNFMGVVKVGETIYPKMPPDEPYPKVGATGNGTLAIIAVHIVGTGVSPLHFEKSKLFTVLYGICIEIDHGAIDGVFDNRPIEMLPHAIFKAPAFGATGVPLTFNASASSDPDGTIAEYFWDFGDGTNATGKIVDHAFTTTGIYTVKLTVTDNDNLTDTAEDYVTVFLYDIAIISVVPSPTTVKTGESVSISVTVTNEGNFTETFNVTACYADTLIETQTDITLTSRKTTTLTFNWNTVDIAAGEYIIKALASHVENETDLNDNTRNGGTVTIEKQSTQITISLDPTIITIGKNITISGVITPAHTAATVTIQYKPTGGNWSLLKTVTTDTNGQYTYNWPPENAGTYEVKAMWEGDATHLGNESSVKPVTIREATVLNTYLYALAGVAIVIAIAIALYFLRTRKRTSVQT